MVDSGGGRADDSETGKWPVLWVSVHDFLLSAARTGGWGLGTYVARCIINQCIYDCDVFSSFFHLYNPYEPSESEKKSHRNRFPHPDRGHSNTEVENNKIRRYGKVRCVRSVVYSFPGEHNVPKESLTDLSARAARVEAISGPDSDRH